MKVFNILYGCFALLWMIANVLLEGFDPSPEINAFIIGGLLLSLGIDEWMDDRKKFAALYLFLGAVWIVPVIIGK